MKKRELVERFKTIVDAYKQEHLNFKLPDLEETKSFYKTCSPEQAIIVLLNSYVNADIVGQDHNDEENVVLTRFLVFFEPKAKAIIDEIIKNSSTEQTENSKWKILLKQCFDAEKNEIAFHYQTAVNFLGKDVWKQIFQYIKTKKTAHAVGRTCKFFQGIIADLTPTMELLANPADYTKPTSNKKTAAFKKIEIAGKVKKIATYGNRLLALATNQEVVVLNLKNNNEKIAEVKFDYSVSKLIKIAEIRFFTANLLGIFYDKRPTTYACVDLFDLQKNKIIQRLEECDNAIFVEGKIITINSRYQKMEIFEKNGALYHSDYQKFIILPKGAVDLLYSKTLKNILVVCSKSENIENFVEIYICNLDKLKKGEPEFIKQAKFDIDRFEYSQELFDNDKIIQIKSGPCLYNAIEKDIQTGNEKKICLNSYVRLFHKDLGLVKTNATVLPGRYLLLNHSNVAEGVLGFAQEASFIQIYDLNTSQPKLIWKELFKGNRVLVEVLSNGNLVIVEQKKNPKMQFLTFATRENVVELINNNNTLTLK